MLLAAALLFIVAGPVFAQPAKGDEATRVRFFLVADSDAPEGAACRMDADNVKAVLDAGLKRQKLDGRYTIDVLAGKDVTPARVLKHYQDLKIGAGESLVFYYSGHGVHNTKKGHLLTLNQGDLARSEVLAAMQKHKPRLAVVLTDCCAVLEEELDVKAPAGLPRSRRGGAWALALDPPPDGPPRPPSPPPKSGGSPPPPANPPRPDPSTSTKVIATLPAHPPRPTNYRPPPPFNDGPTGNPHKDGVVLSTVDGPLALKTLLAETDGELMRHLFFRHTGLVDINGCQKGKEAYAALNWGGGLFTLSFLSLQKERATKFDKNRNGLTEWGEFFAPLQSFCERTGSALTKGKMHQVPEATKLGQYSVASAAK
jgi:hypothetical protein